MAAALKVTNNSPDYNSFNLAIAVLAERLASLPQADKDDLFELTKILFTAENDEELRSAQRAMGEIMEQRPLAVVRVEDADNPAALEKWLGYVSWRIRDAREKAGMSQQELAKASGLTQSHISRLENGEHSPSCATIQKIADALKLPASHFDPSAE